MKNISKFSAIFIVVVILVSFSFKNKKDTYKIYDSKGKEVSYSDVLLASQKAEIILFGELHNNPVIHWMQLELTKDLYQKKPNLIMGAEMLEADNQILLNEYLTGKITEKNFKAEAKLWTNHNTDYQPLVNFAKENKLSFIATNVPRRYASMVYSKGIDELQSLSNDAKQWIAPLPMKYDSTLKGYSEIIKAAGGHGGENLPKSQALKDATMSHFILKNYKPAYTFIHYHGSYHSNNFEGIYWYLKQEKTKLNILTIASVEQLNIDSLSQEYLNMADYIFVIPENMTKTH
ncbi:MAG: ChaN family lipoprotein [Bacteroidetes bacterium]|nr:ChaN family lipoprotein [Bacteroidota bacterium]HET6243238.1 ChaN family lipoprotein [Bacteroidia bacterium]